MNLPPEPLVPFDFPQRTRLVFGAGMLEQLGSIVRELQAKSVLLVTDAGLRVAGHCDRAVRILHSSGLNCVVYDQVTENPTSADVERCATFARSAPVDLIVGLGGGSSMDCAKGANFLLTNGGRIHDYRGVGKASLPMLPMIGIPTTSGTGSEAQSFAVIADSETHVKMACGDPKAAFRVAILDPELTTTMPRFVTAATGIDAMTHAIESFVTTKRNAISQMFARQAWELLSESFSRVLQRPDDLDARGRMQLGAFLAGAAIENSMLGAAHATANPLTARFGVTHGIAVGLMLPHVIRWNSPASAELYRRLNVAAGWDDASGDEASEILANGFTEFLRLADLPSTLKEAIEVSISATDLEEMAADAVKQWTGTFNPRTMTAESFLHLYQRAV